MSYVCIHTFLHGGDFSCHRWYHKNDPFCGTRPRCIPDAYPTDSQWYPSSRAISFPPSAQRNTKYQLLKHQLFMKKSILLFALAAAFLPAVSAQTPANALSGRFSVSADKQVVFSRGNLQYTQSTRTWAFAEQQTDYIGDANITTDADGNNIFADRIDIFGWSGSTGAAQWGVSLSANDTIYSGDFADWGNTIHNGNTWYLPTIHEWRYLFNGRTNADNLIGVARINLNTDGSEYANGLILLPDDWTCPAGLAFKVGFADNDGIQTYADHQTLTSSEWQQLEQAGAVFLPAAGWRYGAMVSDVHNGGYYWSATPYEENDAYYCFFYSNTVNTVWFMNRSFGRAVRLVQDYRKGTNTALPTQCSTDTPATVAHKILRNGQVLIERNNCLYTLTGVETR